MSMEIVCIQTGGSIDKAYPRGDTHHGYNFEITDPAFERVLRECAPHIAYTSQSVCKKDSLDMTDSDRDAVVQAVTRAASERVLITHGTDTIHLTAQCCAAARIPKTIVLTGANLPEVFKGSDAAFHIGMALAGVQTLPHGVYIALNGLLVPHEQYIKQ